MILLYESYIYVICYMIYDIYNYDDVRTEIRKIYKKKKEKNYIWKKNIYIYKERKNIQ